MDVLSKVSDEKQEQHLNPVVATTTPDLPYNKERIAMMSLIIQRIMSVTGSFDIFFTYIEVLKSLKINIAMSLSIVSW